MWPGLHDDLEGVRRACDSCNVNARSNSNLPPRPIEDPEYLSANINHCFPFS